MTTLKKVALLIVAVAILGVAYYALSPLWNGTTLNEPAPTTDTVAATSTGVVTPSPKVVTTAPIVDTLIHPASGNVSLIQTGDSYTVRYENLKTINGPDLFVYLSTDTSASDVINLGPLKATEGSFNYTVPAGTDLEKYHYVLVWCEEFGVLFNSADIGSS